MARTATKKKPAPRARRSVKHFAKELPESIASPSVAHGYTSYQHKDTLGKTITDEKNQRLIIWIGVSAIMTIIVVIWILNLNNLIEPQTLSAQDSKDRPALDVQTLKTELKDTLSQVRDDMKNLQQFSAITQSITPSTAPATISPSATPSVTSSMSPSVTPTATPNTLPN